MSRLGGDVQNDGRKKEKKFIQLSHSLALFIPEARLANSTDAITTTAELTMLTLCGESTVRTVMLDTQLLSDSAGPFLHPLSFVLPIADKRHSIKEHSFNVKICLHRFIQQGICKKKEKKKGLWTHGQTSKNNTTKTKMGNKINERRGGK
jgi:hypothetical protein